jgi:hypothetical protein
MHYIFLKNILETVMTTFACPKCQSKPTEQSVQVTGISSHGVDIHIQCHVCSTHSQLNAEINTIASQMLQSENGKKFLEEFMKNGGTLWAKMENKNIILTTKNKVGIKDEDIQKLDEDIQNAKTIEDLMKWDE